MQVYRYTCIISYHYSFATYLKSKELCIRYESNNFIIEIQVHRYTQEVFSKLNFVRYFFSWYQETVHLCGTFLVLAEKQDNLLNRKWGAGQGVRKPKRYTLYTCVLYTFA